MVKIRIYWNNPYWMSYKKIEDRVIEISHVISFDDDQLYVYSHEIADLIITVTSKIESVLKDLYEKTIYPYNFDKNNKTKYSDIYFYKEIIDDETRREWTLKKCLHPLDEKVELRNKTIALKDNIFRFEHYSNTIKPFGYLDSNNKIIGGLFHKSLWMKKEERKANVGWVDAYNNLKHNYMLAIPNDGNLMNLIFSLSALYLLIIFLEFYGSKRYVLIVGEVDNYFEIDMESKLFTVAIHNDSSFNMFRSSFVKQNEINESISESMLLIIQHPEIKEKISRIWDDYVAKNPQIEFINIDQYSMNGKITNLEEYDVYKKIVLLDKQYSKSRQIILNEGIYGNDIWPYSKVHTIINDERFINKTNIFLSEIKNGDQVEVITLNNEIIKGQILEINEYFLVVKTGVTSQYTFPKVNIKRARIL